MGDFHEIWVKSVDETTEILYQISEGYVLWLVRLLLADTDTLVEVCAQLSALLRGTGLTADENVGHFPLDTSPRTN